MKLLLIISLLFFLLSGCNNQQAIQKTQKNLKIDYIKDISLFKKDNDQKLSKAEIKAIKIANDFLNRNYNKPTKGQFSVARSKTGYQINFHNLQYKSEDNKWYAIKDGFGEIFLSEDFNVLQTAIGP